MLFDRLTGYPERKKRDRASEILGFLSTAMSMLGSMGQGAQNAQVGQNLKGMSSGGWSPAMGGGQGGGAMGGGMGGMGQGGGPMSQISKMMGPMGGSMPGAGGPGAGGGPMGGSPMGGQPLQPHPGPQGGAPPGKIPGQGSPTTPGSGMGGVTPPISLIPGQGSGSGGLPPLHQSPQGGLSPTQPAGRVTPGMGGSMPLLHGRTPGMGATGPGASPSAGGGPAGTGSTGPGSQNMPQHIQGPPQTGLSGLAPQGHTPGAPLGQPVQPTIQPRPGQGVGGASGAGGPQNMGLGPQNMGGPLQRGPFGGQFGGPPRASQFGNMPGAGARMQPGPLQGQPGVFGPGPPGQFRGGAPMTQAPGLMNPPGPPHQAQPIPNQPGAGGPRGQPIPNQPNMSQSLPHHYQMMQNVRSPSSFGSTGPGHPGGSTGPGMTTTPGAQQFSGGGRGPYGGYGPDPGLAIAQRLNAMGYAPGASAGVAGNLAHETGNFTQYNEIGGYGGRGVAQWTDRLGSPRGTQYSRAMGGARPSTVEGAGREFDYLNQDIRGAHGNQWTPGMSPNAMRNMNSGQAAQYFERGFERPQWGSTPQRQFYANQIANRMRGAPNPFMPQRQIGGGSSGRGTTGAPMTPQQEALDMWMNR